MSDTIILRPTGMGNVTNLLSTPSGSSRWQYIDEVSANDSDLVRWTSGTMTYDEYTFENHSRLGSEVIEKITVRTRAKASVVSASPYQDHRIYIYDGGPGKSYKSPTQLGTVWSNNDWEFTLNWDGEAWSWDDINNLYVGVGLSHNNAGTSSVSQVYVTVTFAGPYNYTGDNEIVADPEVGALGSISERTHAHTRELTADPEVGADGTFTRSGGVFTRVMTDAIALAGTLGIEVNLAKWLIIASTESGSVMTRDGSSWQVAAKSATVNPIGASWLAQYDNRLVTLEKENSGFSFSEVNDPISNFTHKPKFPNEPTDFTGLFVGRDAGNSKQLNFLTRKGVGYLDVYTNFVHGFTEVEWEYDANSGNKGMYFRGYTYVLTGKGIYEIADGSAISIGPNERDGLVQEITGPIVDMIGVGFWIVIAINGGASGKSAILKRHINGDHWHIVHKTATPATEINALVWESGTLYFGEGTDVKSMQFSPATDNINEISGYLGTTSAKFRYPYFHSPFESTTKVAHKIHAVTRGMSATEYVDIYYRMDEETDWTLLGRLQASPTPTPLEFKDGNGEPRGIEFERIQIEERWVSAGIADTYPSIESLTLDYRVTPDVLWSWTQKIQANKEQIATLITAIQTKTLMPYYPSGSKDGTRYFVQVVGMPSVQKGTEFGEEGEYEVVLAMVTTEE